jgi:hypothetical protein
MDNFLVSTSRELIELREHFQEIRLMRARMLDSQPGTSQRKDLANLWRKQLRKLSDQANDLRKSLSFPVRGLSSKEKFEYRLTPGFNDRFFGKELELLAEEIAEVEKRVVDYIFAPTHTVSVDSLRSGNMLVGLYRIHRLSRLLEKQISTSEI